MCLPQKHLKSPLSSLPLPCEQNSMTTWQVLAACSGIQPVSFSLISMFSFSLVSCHQLFHLLGHQITVVGFLESSGLKDLGQLWDHCFLL